MPSELTRLVRPVEFEGLGPFRLPKMKAALPFGKGSRGWPMLRLQTEKGEEVWIPLAAAQIDELRRFADAWITLQRFNRGDG